MSIQLSPSKPALTDLGRHVVHSDAVGEGIRYYQAMADDMGDTHLVVRRRAYMELVNKYFDLVTDFYEYGWDQAFHFAPRHKGETFRESLRRHEHYLALRLGLKPGETVLDAGCGIGGPMRSIARFAGADIVGINNHDYQIGRAKALNAAAKLDGRCRVLKGDFMAIPLPGASVDKAYAIEATVLAPSLEAVYREIARVLKPGGLFATYEWCMTDRYDPDNATHRALKDGMCVGGGCPDMGTSRDVLAGLSAAGFEVIHHEDVAAVSDVPWYEPLAPHRLTPATLRSSPIGRRITNTVLSVLETLRLVPRGTTAVARMLHEGACDMVAAGKAGIFTPAYLAVARKL
jgi:sterol 24-C-methyltransferase